MKKINVQWDWTPQGYAYVATFDDYDGAPDAPNRGEIGIGRTPEAAIAELVGEG
jgi:hypothetical protein